MWGWMSEEVWLNECSSIFDDLYMYSPMKSTQSSVIGRVFLPELIMSHDQSWLGNFYSPASLSEKL